MNPAGMEGGGGWGGAATVNKRITLLNCKKKKKIKRVKGLWRERVLWQEGGKMQ